MAKGKGQNIDVKSDEDPAFGEISEAKLAVSSAANDGHTPSHSVFTSQFVPSMDIYSFM